MIIYDKNMLNYHNLGFAKRFYVLNKSILISEMLATKFVFLVFVPI